jgi:hypothetical protein
MTLAEQHDSGEACRCRVVPPGLHGASGRSPQGASARGAFPAVDGR